MLVCVDVLHHFMMAVAFVGVGRGRWGAVGRHWGRWVVDGRGNGRGNRRDDRRDGGGVGDGYWRRITLALVAVGDGHGGDGPPDGHHLNGLHVGDVVMAVAAALVAFVALVAL